MFLPQLRILTILVLIGSATAKAEGLQQYDLLVYGSTPGGIACAVRSAREGLSVQLVTHSDHLGGMLTSGLSTMDTLYNGSRSPLYDELRQAIYGHYRNEYGEDSPQYLATQPGHPKTRYEAGVVERLIDEMVAAEPQIDVVKGHYPIEFKRDGAILRTVTFRRMDGDETFEATASVFADCSYEADLAAVAKVPYRVGRESRDEFNEPHAGVIYMRRVDWPPANVDAGFLAFRRGLNLYQYDAWYEVLESASTGEAHPAVQGYNMRTVVTNNPDNFVPIEKPADYDPEFFRSFGPGNPSHPGLTMPNDKFGMNEPKLVGVQDAYVEGDWAARRAVTERHREATLGLLYFRQTDPSVPESVRAEWRKIGLPKDEFADNGHTPYEIYARETRRIMGRAVFTEHDAQLAADLERAPIHRDSISITEWFLDSHACTPREVEGSEPEGMVMLKNQTLPGQVSFQTVFAKDYDNLVVPVCLSATHVGWGTIRLEPTWMSISEATAYAIAIAKQDGITPDKIDRDALLRKLAEARVMLSFFNDVEDGVRADWYPAVQYLGTQGYFGTYNALPTEPLKAELANAWTTLFGKQLRGDQVDATAEARIALAAEKEAGSPITASEFAQRLSQEIRSASKTPPLFDALFTELGIVRDQLITRGDACRVIYDVIAKERSQPGLRK